MNNINIILPSSVIIEEEVEILDNVVINPNTIIKGKCKIGNNVTLGPNVELNNVIIDDNSKIKNSLIEDSKIGKNVEIGPYSHIHSNSIIYDNVRIGNYVEIKKSIIKSNTKIKHLSYIGDSFIGENVNVGAGVIIANYDGKNKYQTIIKDNAFIGSSVTIISPVIINENSKVAAGSIITEDVPAFSLAIARSHQINKINKYK